MENVTVDKEAKYVTFYKLLFYNSPMDFLLTPRYQNRIELMESIQDSPRIPEGGRKEETYLCTICTAIRVLGERSVVFKLIIL